MTDQSLFPETLGLAPPTDVTWHGTTLNKWGHPRVDVRLIAQWSEAEGWSCGWCVRLDGAVDEWHPAAPNEYRRHAHYPWYRLDEFPRGKTFAVAAGNAARAAKIVLEQMTAHAIDAAGAADARCVSAQIETQAQRWLKGEELGAPA